MSDDPPNDHFVYRPTDPPSAPPTPPPNDHLVYPPLGDPSAEPAEVEQPAETPAEAESTPIDVIAEAPASPSSIGELPPSDAVAPPPPAVIPDAPVQLPDAEPTPAAATNVMEIPNRPIGANAYTPDPGRTSSTAAIPKPQTWLPKALVGLLTISAALTAILTAHHNDSPAPTAFGGAGAFGAGKDRSGPLPLRRGMQYYVYKTVTVQVPKGWQPSLACHDIKAPTVVLSPGGNEKACNTVFRSGVTELLFDPVEVSHEPFTTVTTTEAKIDGHYSQRNVAKVPSTGATYGTLYIADADVHISVITPNANLANQILNSARVDPSVAPS